MIKDETKTSVLSCLSPSSWLGFVTSVMVCNPGIQVADPLWPLCSDLCYGNWPCSPFAFAKYLMANLQCNFLHYLFFVSPFVMSMQGVLPSQEAACCQRWSSGSAPAVWILALHSSACNPTGAGVLYSLLYTMEGISCLMELFLRTAIITHTLKSFN